MITLNSRIKCDICGKFIRDINIAHVYFVPDSDVSTEELNHYCKKCYVKK
jgi:hypothetical protein